MVFRQAALAPKTMMRYEALVGGGADRSAAFRAFRRLTVVPMDTSCRVGGIQVRWGCRLKGGA
jgi:hypothetical protein